MCAVLCCSDLCCCPNKRLCLSAATASLASSSRNVQQTVDSEYGQYNGLGLPFFHVPLPREFRTREMVQINWHKKIICRSTFQNSYPAHSTYTPHNLLMVVDYPIGVPRIKRIAVHQSASEVSLFLFLNQYLSSWPFIIYVSWIERHLIAYTHAYRRLHSTQIVHPGRAFLSF